LFWDLTPTQSYKEFLQIFEHFKGCNVVHINCKCVKEVLLHRTCHALQSGDEHESGLKPILARSGLDRTAIFLKIGGSGLDRTGKIFCCFDVIIPITSKF